MSYKVLDINVATGEIIERNPTAAEITQKNKDEAEQNAKITDEAAKIAAKAELLNRLGITETEAKLLFS